MRSVSGVVIAGGTAQRMSGLEKGLVMFDGKPMFLWVAQAMESIANSIFLNVNRHESDYLTFGYLIVKDCEPYADRGPLSGLWQALKKVETTHLLLSPCDTPNISQNAFHALNQASIDHPELIFCLQSKSGFHPLHAIIPVESALQCLTAFLAEAKGNSVMAFYQRHGYECLNWPVEKELLNINYQEQIISV